MTEWQPIETAPKDGTIIDLWVVSLIRTQERARRVTGARWTHRWVRTIEDGDWSGEDEDIEGTVDQDVATHWMPLPDPPP